MPAKLFRLLLICLLSMAGLLVSLAQTPSEPQRQNPTRTTRLKQEPTPEASPSEEQQEVEVLKINTNLVTVPVIASNANGTYVPDLSQSEFRISEDGVKQEVAFFATITAPFHVVLLLDTSGSTQDKLPWIQRAAIAFVEQLQSGDRVKVISFDDQVRDLNDFTNDRAVLKDAIYKTASGQGTKLYDALDLALSSIRRIQGRKAIVLFTDGVDWRSDEATFDGTLRGLDEEGVIVYPIRFETRRETERIARDQANDQSPQLPTIGVLRKPTPGTTAPTFPSDDPVPTSGTGRKTGSLGLPPPSEILRRRRTDSPDSRYPPDRVPPPDRRNREPPGSSIPKPPDGTPPLGSGDSISVMLDQLYKTADSYLNELANKSGGRLVGADTLGSLPAAFANIAAELRTQYTLGYYPTNKARDGKYRKIKVTTTRKDVLLRARPGYRSPTN